MKLQFSISELSSYLDEVFPQEVNRYRIVDLQQGYARVIQNITQENFTDLYDVTPVTTINDNNVLYYDGSSGSYKWRDFTFRALLDTDTPAQNDDAKIVYYNHSTCSA